MKSNGLKIFNKCFSHEGVKFNDHFSYYVSFPVSFCLILNGCHTGKIKWEEETGRRVHFSHETHCIMLLRPVFAKCD